MLVRRVGLRGARRAAAIHSAGSASRGAVPQAEAVYTSGEIHRNKDVPYRNEGRGDLAPRRESAAPVFRNVDGERIDDGRYTRFKQDVSRIVSEDRIITDEIRKFAYGTDASFYRLVPQLVVKVKSEKEIQQILPLALKHRTPVTFRAAGTSLSGQAITDSVLLKLSHTGKAFRNFEIKARSTPDWLGALEVSSGQVLTRACSPPINRRGGR